MTTRRNWLVTGFALSLLFVGLLRYSAFTDTVLTPFAGYATVAYVALTIITGILLGRAGVELNRFGFGFRIRSQHLLLGLAAVAFLQISSVVVDPLLDGLFGAGRDLSRFDDVRGSLPALLGVLALSWTFAAFGEEIAFRIVLLRGIWSALGDSTTASVIAVVLQAVIFGLVHLYQGPAGVVSTTLNGIVFGAVTVMARGAIWPAALAHGINNTIGLLTIYLGADG
ncbi:MAG: CPBP family intramembrane metalloprotease [Gammaproteobacteria bacterium]|nr:CPBP family intramembrane metalloprotease [Gammaproteobacteria bacterium]